MGNQNQTAVNVHAQGRSYPAYYSNPTIPATLPFNFNGFQQHHTDYSSLVMAQHQQHHMLAMQQAQATAMAQQQHQAEQAVNAQKQSNAQMEAYKITKEAERQMKHGN